MIKASEFIGSIYTNQITGSDLQNLIRLNTGVFSLSDFVAVLVNLILYIAGILAFIFLVYSGILYITAAGNPDNAKKAQQGVINAIIGIIVITLSLVIIRVVTNLARNIGQ